MILYETSEPFNSKLDWNVLGVVLCKMSVFMMVENPR